MLEPYCSAVERLHVLLEKMKNLRKEIKAN